MSSLTAGSGQCRMAASSSRSGASKPSRWAGWPAICSACTRCHRRRMRATAGSLATIALVCAGYCAAARWWRSQRAPPRFGIRAAASPRIAASTSRRSGRWATAWMIFRTEMTLPYPPPYQDLRTLAEHLCLGESTVEAWVKVGKLPPPVVNEGKRLWRWKDVERRLAQLQDDRAQSTDASSVREATRAALEGSH